MSAVQIDKGIPMPDRPHGRANNGRSRRWPWDEMELGDSFLATDATQNSISAAGNNASKRTGHKYTTSKCRDGVRVWRVK